MYTSSILTDMKMVHIKLDDDLANLLERYPNKSEIIRQSLKMYIESIPTDTVESMKASYKILIRVIKELDSKIDFIARKVQ